jgi:hypothetical protein
MHLQDHSTSQQVLSATLPKVPVVLAVTAQVLVFPTGQVVEEQPSTPTPKQGIPVRTVNTLMTRKPDEGAYLRLALKACQLEQRFPPTSSCYEVDDRSLPSVSSF